MGNHPGLPGEERGGRKREKEDIDTERSGRGDGKLQEKRPDFVFLPQRISSLVFFDPLAGQFHPIC